MSRHTAKRFWRAFERLPEETQKVARENIDLLKSDPHHPSLHFKRVGKLVGASRLVTSRHRRRLASRIVWFWIGPHEEYDRLIREA